MLLYVYLLSPASTSVQMSCSVSRSDIIVKSWEFRRNHKPPCSVYIRCRGVNGYFLTAILVSMSMWAYVHTFPEGYRPKPRAVLAPGAVVRVEKTDTWRGRGDLQGDRREGNRPDDQHPDLRG